MEFDIGGKVGMGWVAVVALLFGYLISGINNLMEAPTGRHNATDNCLLQNSLRPLRIFLPLLELPHVHVHVRALQLDLHVVVVVVHREPADERLGVLVILDLIVVPQRHVAQLLLLSHRDV